MSKYRKFSRTLDCVYKMSAPLTLCFIAFSYFHSVKPVFDKHEELQNASQELATLTDKNETLLKQVTTKESELSAVEENLASISEELKSKNVALVELESDFDSVTNNYEQVQGKFSDLSSDYQVLKASYQGQEEELSKLKEQVRERKANLNEVNEQLVSAEESAITFYLYQVVSDVYRRAPNSLIGDNKEFDLKATLLEIVESDRKQSGIKPYSSEYYTQLGLDIVEEFANNELANGVTDPSKVFELLKFYINNRYQRQIDKIYQDQKVSAL